MDTLIIMAFAFIAFMAGFCNFVAYFYTGSLPCIVMAGLSIGFLIYCYFMLSSFREEQS
jgi:hypothetical protein